MDALRRRRLLLDAEARAPLGRRPERPWLETAPAIGANVEKLGFGAVGAIRAFVGTDPGFRRVRRQIPITQFTARSQFEGRSLPFRVQPAS